MIINGQEYKFRITIGKLERLLDEHGIDLFEPSRELSVRDYVTVIAALLEPHIDRTTLADALDADMIATAMAELAEAVERFTNPLGTAVAQGANV